MYIGKKKGKERRYNQETSEFVLYPHRLEQTCGQIVFIDNLQIIFGYKLKDFPFDIS